MVSFQTADRNPADGGQILHLAHNVELPFSLMVPAGTVVNHDSIRLVKREEMKKDEGILAIKFGDGSIKKLRDEKGNWVRKGFQGWVTVEDFKGYWAFITCDMVIKTFRKA
jgi:hypothetical protein